MNDSRRKFISQVSSFGLALVAGKSYQLSAHDIFNFRNKVKLRFVVASDAHYGQPKTDYDVFLQTAVQQINTIHGNISLDFCVINGDIIHDKKEFLIPAQNLIKELKMPFYVTKGNHDLVSDIYWNEIWQIPVNHYVKIKNNGLLFLTTSNEKGEYLSPNLNWLQLKLDEAKKLANTFLFVHIPQAKWTINGIETPAFFELLKKYPNIKAIFHGHEHDQDGVKMRNGLPFIFDSHIGGSWGTPYKGFRVVELLRNNSMLTYMMDPIKKGEELVF